MTSSVPLWRTKQNHITIGTLASSRTQLSHRTTVVQGEQFTVSWITKSYESNANVVRATRSTCTCVGSMYTLGLVFGVIGGFIIPAFSFILS